MRRVILPLLFVIPLVIAGCVSPAGSVDAATAPDAASAAGAWWERATPSGEEHDHTDPAQHAGLSTPNFEVLGSDDLQTARFGTTAAGMGCGNVGTTSEGRRIAVVHTIATEVAFIVADVTDPANPQYLGEYLMPNSVIWDASVTADGKHAIVGAYPFAFSGRGVVLPKLAGLSPEGLPLYAMQFYWRDYCTGETVKAGPEQYLPFGPGIVLVGLQDPTQPTFEDWVSQPVIGPHSVTGHEIDGKQIVTASVTNLVHDASYYSFFEVATLPTGAGKLVPLSVIRAPGPRPGDFGNGHIDVDLAKHPGDGKVYAYLANWDDGMRIYDMSDMRAPKLVSTWRDGNAGSLHTTYSIPEMWGDKHYVIAGQEVGEPEELPTGWIYVIDDTDPANPVEVGRWTLPHKFSWKDKTGDNFGLGFSPHYVAVVNRTLFVTNYHGGLWAIDLSQDVTNPQAIGVFVPDVLPEKWYRDAPQGPFIEDVVAAPDGSLTVWDGSRGILNVRFDASQPMPRAPAWEQ